jgi:thiaminase/transcriptional activator TenA
MLFSQPYVLLDNGSYRGRGEKQIINHSVKRPPDFDAWIDMYSGDVFESNVKDYIAMVDAVCESVTAEEFDEMTTHFLMSCKLEHMFWDQALNMMKWPEIGGL